MLKSNPESLPHLNKSSNVKSALQKIAIGDVGNIKSKSSFEPPLITILDTNDKQDKYSDFKIHFSFYFIYVFILFFSNDKTENFDGK